MIPDPCRRLGIGRGGGFRLRWTASYLVGWCRVPARTLESISWETVARSWTPVWRHCCKFVLNTNQVALSLSLASAGSCIDRHLGIDMYISMYIHCCIYIWCIWTENTDRHSTLCMGDNAYRNVVYTYIIYVQLYGKCTVFSWICSFTDYDA